MEGDTECVLTGICAKMTLVAFFKAIARLAFSASRLLLWHFLLQKLAMTFIKLPNFETINMLWAFIAASFNYLLIS